MRDGFVDMGVMSMTTGKQVTLAVEEARSASFPLTFDGTVGLFSPARGAARRVAVLFVSPWGLEEMCGRKFFRILAERLAENGFASLRFDYPGTGDSLADDVEKIDLQVWLDSFSTAATRLKQLSGCDRLVVVAQGVGATVAIKALEAGADCEAIALLAPVVSGRSYTREIAAMAQMINDKLQITEPVATGAGLTMAGLSMSEGLVGDIKKIDLMKVDACSARMAIVFCRSERPADAAFTDHLATLGVDVRPAPFDGYAKLTTNPTVAVVPDEVVGDLLAWMTDRYPEQGAAWDVLPPSCGSHGGEGFLEQPTRLGADGRMFGILCGPSAQMIEQPVSVLLLSSGYDRMSGWGRSSVKLARALAQQGISSLRFDCANVADSPPVPGLEGQVLYEPAQLDDVSAALDLLTERMPGVRIIAAGRCSGAYLALQAAWTDDRIDGVVAVNPETFEWQPGRSVEDALDNPTQSMDHYVSNLWRLSTFRRIARGEVDLLSKARQVSSGIGRRLLRPLVWLTGGLTARERVVCAGFRTLAQRGVSVKLLYSPGDIGLEEFGHFFGAGGGQLVRFSGMSHAVVAGADHNFTPRQARDTYLDAILEMAGPPEKRVAG